MTDNQSRLPNLGPRGEGWVAAQGMLLAATVLAGLVEPRRASSRGNASSAVGGVAVVAGILIVAAAYAAIRPSFSPFPRPVATGTLVESGIYGRIRHPMYVGVVLVASGWSLVSCSILALVFAIGLALLLDAKARREEAWLMTSHPAYRTYRGRTRRFLPWIY